MSRARYGSHMYNCYVRDRGRCTASGSRAPLATVSKNRSKIRNVCQILLCCLKGNKVIQGWTNTLSCCTVSEMILGITNDVLQNSFSKLLNRGAKNTVNFCSSALMESYNMLDKTQRDKLRERQ